MAQYNIADDKDRHPTPTNPDATSMRIKQDHMKTPTMCRLVLKISLLLFIRKA